jgi:hypothetical protein
MSCGSHDRALSPAALTPDLSDPSTLSPARRHAIRGAIAAGRFREALALLALPSETGLRGSRNDRAGGGW